MSASITIAVAQLPYPCFDREGWEDTAASKLRDASHEPDVSGIYLLIAERQGYDFQNLVVCRKDGSAEGSVWTSMTRRKQTWSIRFEHQPERSLESLRAAWQARRVSPGGPRDASRGRNVTLFIVSNADCDWLTCQTPLIGATHLDDLDVLILDLQAVPGRRTTGNEQEHGGLHA